MYNCYTLNQNMAVWKSMMLSNFRFISTSYFKDEYIPLSKCPHLLKHNSKGIDAHELKDEFMGNSSNSIYDLFLDKDTGKIWIFRKGGKGSGIPTGEYIN